MARHSANIRKNLLNYMNAVTEKKKKWDLSNVAFIELCLVCAKFKLGK